MKYYRKTSHTVFDVKAHIVWITKYRKKVLYGQVAERARELIREVCKEHDVEILSGHIGKEHVHLLVSIPPFISISKLVQYIKGKSSIRIHRELGGARGTLFGRKFWARGYCVSTVGLDEDTIRRYIREQEKWDASQDSIKLDE